MFMPVQLSQDPSIHRTKMLDSLGSVIALVYTAAFSFQIAVHLFYNCKSISDDNIVSDEARKSRKIALLATIASLVLALVEGPTEFYTPLIFAIWLNYSEIYYRPQRVASTSLLLWWPIYAIFVAADFLARTPILTSALQVPHSVAAWKLLCAIVAMHFELSSCPPQPTSFDDSHVYLKLSCGYLNSMMDSAWKTGRLQAADVPSRPQFADAGRISESFKRYFQLAKPFGRHRLAAALIVVSSWTFAACVLSEIALSAIGFLKPLVMSRYLGFLKETSIKEADDGNEHIWLAFLYAFESIVQMAIKFLRGHYGAVLIANGRTSILSSVLLKVFRIDNQLRSLYTSGKLLNLISVDIMAIQMSLPSTSRVLIMPFKFAFGMAQICKHFGKSVIAIIPVYILYMIACFYVARSNSRRLPEKSKVCDARIKLTHSMLKNIKSVKLYAWEEPFEAQVNEARDDEVKVSLKHLNISTTYNMFTGKLDSLVLAVMVLSYLWFEGKPLPKKRLIYLMTLIHATSSPVKSFYDHWHMLNRAFHSEARITKLLLEPEEQHENFSQEDGVAASDWDTALVDVRNANVSWAVPDETKSATALRNITFDLKRGDLCCVIGHVGSGKTALIDTLIGQMNITSGSATVRGSTAYAGQENWLQYLSIRENILFGSEYDAEFYKVVLDACQITQDLEQFPKGDETLIGEKGVSLSGGQRARVALARAVYSRADVFILDDLLSAVDEYVSTRILESLFVPGGLLSSKAVIIATHSAKLLKYSSKLLCLSSDGSIAYYGDARSAKPDDLIPLYSHDATDITSLSASLLPPADYDRIRESRALCDRSWTSESESDKEPESDDSAAVAASSKSILHSEPSLKRWTQAPAARLDNTETQNADAILDRFSNFDKVPGVSLYEAVKRFLLAGEMKWILLSGFGLALASALNIACESFLFAWTDTSHLKSGSSRAYIFVYVGLIYFTSFIEGKTRFIQTGVASLATSTKLHKQMLHNVIHAPLLFFEQTPLGTILGRFSADMRTLDGDVSRRLYGFLRDAISALMNFAFAFALMPYASLVFIPVSFQCVKYIKKYIVGFRQAQSLLTATRSATLSHIEESYIGSPTIQAFGRSSVFVKRMDVTLNNWLRIFYVRFYTRRWLSFRLLMLSLVIRIVSASFMLLLENRLGGNAKLAAVVMTLAMEQTLHDIPTLVASFAEFNMNVSSLERVYGFIDQATEAPYVSTAEAADPEKSENHEWLTRGVVEFQNYSTKFKADQGEVLKHISLSIKPRERIGIVGRTGAGKSTLTLALFRILEASDGRVVIDDHDISKLGLRDLRRSISIIPQDAQIFRGSLRLNLDPFNDHTDDDLWKILELCHLSNHFSSLNGLSTMLEDGGGNISRGQAQLICLGRALLRPSKLLVMDEATAAVDGNTDSLIQATVRKEFTEQTIITVAHRINTIMDSDRIVVIDQGKIVEQGPPQQLLEKKGKFYELVTSNQNL